MTTLNPGTRIGPYEVRELLGAGGMGEVYRAHDLRLGRDVALKTLPGVFAADTERIGRFEREARMLATLNHANIATIHGLERQGEVLALVMELVEGETLEDRLLRAALPGRGLEIPAVLQVARQLVAALDAAHEKNIVHRDLKPANVKLTADDEVKVLDFGLAKAIESGLGPAGAPATTELRPATTELGVVLGTPAYMSPEQARGQPVDKRTDIWAFGCILYELLAGHRAFTGDTVSDTMAAVLRAEVDLDALPADVPVSLRKLVARCLEKNAKARLRDIADARPYLEDDWPTAGPQATPDARSGISRRAALFGGAMAGVLGTGIGAGAMMTRRAPPTAVPSYHRLTFRRGMILTARFGPDFQTIFYGARWDDDVCRVYTVRPESPESTALSLPPGAPLAVSVTGELALSLGRHFRGITPDGTLARVPLAGGAPRELVADTTYADWSPDGSDLAVVRRVDGRSQLEFPVGNVLAEPESPGGSFVFARVSPRGDAVAAFEWDAGAALVGRLVIIDRSGAKRVVSRRYFNVYGLAWHGEEVWFSAADELPLFRNAVHAMDASGAVRVVARMPSNVSLHDIAPDGRALMARTEDRISIALRVTGQAEERDLSWLDGSLVADLSVDGRRTLFTEGGVGGGPRFSTYLRGIDGSLPVRLGDGFALALSPDGRSAIVRSDVGAPHLDVISTGAGQATRLERPGLVLLEARWLPDGRNVVVTAEPQEGQVGLYVLDVEGTTARRVTPEARGAGASWAVSPDGTMVADAMGQGVELLPLAGGDVRRVPGSEGARVEGWIESGLLLSAGDRETVFRVDPATGQRETWADLRPQDPAGVILVPLGRIIVTPDGRSYAYNWARAVSDLFLVEGWG